MYRDGLVYKLLLKPAVFNSIQNQN